MGGVGRRRTDNTSEDVNVKDTTVDNDTASVDNDTADDDKANDAYRQFVIDAYSVIASTQEMLEWMKKDGAAPPEIVEALKDRIVDLQMSILRRAAGSRSNELQRMDSAYFKENGSPMHQAWEATFQWAIEWKMERRRTALNSSNNSTSVASSSRGCDDSNSELQIDAEEKQRRLAALRGETEREESRIASLREEGGAAAGQKQQLDGSGSPSLTPEQSPDNADTSMAGGSVSSSAAASTMAEGTASSPIGARGESPGGDSMSSITDQ